MTREPQTTRLTQCVTGMMTLERAIEALLDRLQGQVRGHPEAAAAFGRFHATAAEHRQGLAAHLRELGALSDVPDEGTNGQAPAATAVAHDGTHGLYPGLASQGLRDAYLAFNEAALGYGVLHETAHVFDSVRFAATLRLAERHLRHYTRAAQEINQLLAEVVAWELRQGGQFCECQCPSCELGICWCIAHTTDTLNQAWRDTAPPYPSPGLRVAPNLRRPADLDVREGDLVIAVDGHRVATTSDVTTAVMSRGSGEPITFGIDRKAVGAIEITTTRR